MTERKSLSKLWRESGKKVPFAQFAREFDSRKFRNFVINETVDTMFKPTVDMVKKQMQPVAIQPESAFDKKQGVLLLTFGAAAGVIIGLLLVKHLNK